MIYMMHVYVPQAMLVIISLLSLLVNPKHTTARVLMCLLPIVLVCVQVGRARGRCFKYLLGVLAQQNGAVGRLRTRY